MKFTTREDVEAPIEAVFDMMCEFETFERAAMRRGADVQRLDSMTSPGTGMGWRAQFVMRGKERDVQIKVTQFDRPHQISLTSTSPGLNGTGDAQLMALSKTRTRMTLEFEVTATTLSARLLLQSLKLAKSTLTKRFKLRAAQFAKSLEDRHNARA